MHLDRLLAALTVDVEGFAICEVASGWRLAFGPDAAPTIHYALKGEGVMRVGADHAFPIQQGCFVLLPRMVPHSFEADGGAQELRVDAAFSDAPKLFRLRAGEGPAKLATVCGAIRATYGAPVDLFESLTEPISVDLSDTPVLHGAFLMLLDELTAPAIGTRALAETLLKQCLILLLRRHSSAGGVTGPWLTALKDPPMAAVISAMVERPQHPFSLDDLAAISGLGRSAFVNHFHAAFQKSPIELLREIRLRLAARLLRTTHLPVKVVAGRVGYSSRSYFSRAFAELYGVDPTRFRLTGSAEDVAKSKTDAQELQAIPEPRIRSSETKMP